MCISYYLCILQCNIHLSHIRFYQCDMQTSPCTCFYISYLPWCRFFVKKYRKVITWTTFGAAETHLFCKKCQQTLKNHQKKRQIWTKRLKLCFTKLFIRVKKRSLGQKFIFWSISACAVSAVLHHSLWNIPDGVNGNRTRSIWVWSRRTNRLNDATTSLTRPIRQFNTALVCILFFFFILK